MIGLTSLSLRLWLPIILPCSCFHTAPIHERAGSLLSLWKLNYCCLFISCMVPGVEKRVHWYFFSSFLSFTNSFCFSFTLCSDTPPNAFPFPTQISCKCILNFFISDSLGEVSKETGFFCDQCFVRVSLVCWEQRAQRLVSWLQMGVGGCRVVEVGTSLAWESLPVSCVTLCRNLEVRMPCAKLTLMMIFRFACMKRPTERGSGPV